jgi:hypothetical protein
MSFGLSVFSFWSQAISIPSLVQIVASVRELQSNMRAQPQFQIKQNCSCSMSLNKMTVSRMSGDFISVLQNLIPDVITCHRCNTNIRLILNGYVLWVFEIQDDFNIHTITDVLPAWRRHLHFSRHATQYLNKLFPDQWIGRGGPQKWPPRSPDPTPLDFN